MPRFKGVGQKKKGWAKKEDEKRHEKKGPKKVKLSISPHPHCTVCKRFQTKEEEMNANIYDNNDSDIDDQFVPAHNRYSGLKTKCIFARAKA